MFRITYAALLTAISFLWLLVRIRYWKKNGGISWKREIQLLLVYICVIVVARFTFFPFSKVDGKIQPLIFDVSGYLTLLRRCLWEQAGSFLSSLWSRGP